MFAELEGIKMFYEDEGEGEPVILIAGINANNRFWKSMVPLLEGYRVIRFDNPGVGKTEYEGEITIERVADDVLQLIDYLGFDKVHMVGWSWGSQIAQSFAARHQEKLKTLTLVSSYERRPARSAYFMKALAQVAMDSPHAMDSMNVSFNAFCFAESKFTELEEKGIMMPITKNPENPNEVIKQMISMDKFDSSKDTHKIKVPTLVVHGDADIMVEPVKGRAIKDAIEGCRYLEVHDMGHTIPPEFYIEELKKLLSDNKM